MRLKHRDMLSHGRGSRLKDPSADPPRIARGLYPSGMLAHTFWPRIGRNPSMPSASAWDLGAHTSSRLSTNSSLSLILSSTSSPSQGSGWNLVPRVLKAWGLLDAAQWAHHYRPVLLQCLARGVTQRNKYLL
jgi:hypothetical protein